MAASFWNQIKTSVGDSGTCRMLTVCHISYIYCKKKITPEPKFQPDWRAILSFATETSYWLGAFFQKRYPLRRPCARRDIQLHVLSRHSGNRRRQVSPDRGRYRRAAHLAASLAYVSRAHFRGRFSVHQRIAPPTPENGSRSAGPLVPPPIVLSGADDLLDDPCAVYGLAQ